MLVMLYSDAYVWFYSGNRRQEMIQNLLGSHAERPSACRYFQPAALVAEVALSNVLCANQDTIGVIAKVHEMIVSGIRSLRNGAHKVD